MLFGLVQQALRFPAGTPPRGLAQLALDGRPEPAQTRLAQAVLGPRAHHGHELLLGRRARYHDQGQVALVAREGVEDGEGAELRQGVIGHDHVPRVTGKSRGQRRLGLHPQVERLESAPPKLGDDELRVLGAVVGNEDPKRCGHVLPCLRGRLIRFVPSILAKRLFDVHPLSGL